jgi:phosphoribosylglycinamide formyltransferase-1
LSEPRIVVLISGGGRNLQALIDHTRAGHIQGRIAGVISNRADAGGLARAAEAGIPAQVIPHTQFAAREDFDRALADAVRAQRPDIVVLAGFMRVLGPAFIGEFHGRLLNIHPSLLPKHPGLKTHERALAAGDAQHGASVHFVTPEVDGGPVIVQGRFGVLAGDTAQTLADRVMREVEVKIYPQAVAWMARGALRLIDGRVAFNGKPLAKPLSMQDLETPFR